MRWLCRVESGGPIRSQHEDSVSEGDGEVEGDGEDRWSAATSVVIGVHEMDGLEGDGCRHAAMGMQTYEAVVGSE